MQTLIKFFPQAKSILLFERLICVKYNRRYHFFDEARSLRMLNSDNKHFANDLLTHAETQIFHCINIKFMC